jgi:tetratricopeptide (TPR) repeat protein
MSIFQFLLFIISIIVFVLFFKQLFSGAFPKRGIDFEAKRDNEQIGGITQMDKSFSTPPPKLSRVAQLTNMADIAIEEKDFIEADKALSSALILDKDNIELLLKYGFVLINLNRLDEAKDVYLEIISLNPQEDMALVSLANIYHKLDDNKKALDYHQKSIEIDPNYAPHYFNYANTLYDIGQKDRALTNYKKAYKLDPSIEEAERMIKELSL